MSETGIKSEAAFRTIGELATELGLPQHILRYWETRFPQLRPLQRAGNRRYYRPDDVALARRIDRLLNHEGYTVKGVQKLLAGHAEAVTLPSSVPASAPQPSDLLPALRQIRDRLAKALAADDLAARV
jgi:DNA-binding transcriptional MerR regulator